MEAIAGIKTAREIATEYDVHPTQVAQWKRELSTRSAEIFDRAGSVKQEKDLEAIEQRNHAKIGQLTLEVDWLRKKCRQLQIPLDGER
jgi:transposase-like protein